ncbi:MAG: SAM-dependent chlorinase/fluorinase [candidate division KSB1 bacterium]|nr:SAM-dependent chlorinase/fluorinase [candidate division KSB1 bacterium]MDZ7273719.1 SAM-dependent chlorinase/fluorinase [candidate division KSB1 bacterium]MDZ7285875.1 SAM-dependent chlorinase/fluorinase [candidate division KSB1 bacterium]MDZ7298907.1 SAM-dependent chlorinase/fluorinase [candidate division KSB1 bacterium]MDZ7309465.1 SAM-dependent chlorinase/fluorinase [candidate division KSB1 bacterium]
MAHLDAPPPAGIITLLTDFGTADGYVAAMKGVILSLARHVTLVDLTHEVPPQQVAIATFILSAHFYYFPAGTIHLAVVDPGVGTARAAVACCHRGHYFLAPDNGLLDFCSRDPACKAVRLNKPEFWRGEISNTFHGRDVFAPVAAHLASGVALELLGEPVRLMPHQPQPAGKIASGRLLGEVIYCDHFGNLITNISRAELAAFAGTRAIGIHLADKTLHTVHRSYAEVPAGHLVALINSFDLLEIGINQGNAAQAIPAARGTPVIIVTGD